ncbi:MAG: M15 family metallopeptidase [Lachnospiraceae bacterium]|nr:M15 family metallopeptidase [Lachnospiraceae bacterium]
MICAFLAHYLTGSETLEEYAENNPELAYASDETSETENTDTTLPDADTVAESPAYNSTEDDTSEIETMTANSDRTTYQDGFYYEPLSENIKERITGISYPETGCTVPYEDLRYVGLLYVDFDGATQAGELICNKAIAQDMVEIFYELYRNDYRIERVRLVDEYDGDDTLSMLDNNTSCFNYRVVDGTTTLSKHALGCAIDINPFYNPYIVYNKNGSGETYISPKGSEIYADRSQNFPYKIDENDLCYKLFTAHGFTWGGNWNSTKDYQHFQIVLP